MGKQEQIYGLANGYFTEDVAHTVDGVVIPDEFCEGSFCSRLYEEIAKRKKKICEKLQVDEDLDLEHILNCMEDFTRYMSMKMYEYGALMGTKE